MMSAADLNAPLIAGKTDPISQLIDLAKCIVVSPPVHIEHAGNMVLKFVSLLLRHMNGLPTVEQRVDVFGITRELVFVIRSTIPFY